MAYDRDELVTYSVVALSRITTLSPRAIRLYEDRGLLFAKRDRLNKRRFDRQSVRRLELIKLLRTAGMSLRDIRAILALQEGSVQRAQVARAALSALREDLTNRVAALEAAEHQLIKAVSAA
ncbi:transcriptional regulator, putative MerR family [Phenylobacterium zucineum HLK1]|uniref:Transcriptional regulator, putative MerR family n=1 Tax=Phenylobacterium zucineum (strain HLK1) TaxID=450851 RepID=B4RFW1_PHEZH|nr:MerR family transcriptional regulator [Phenylobacterium zucineum]ACG78774.1 transcriptional regulator, putative MerR family [Phenylobacterium zucineum HLK1]